MSYKKQRPLTATFPAKERRTWSVCNSEVPPQAPARPKTALSRHIVQELDKQLGTKEKVPLKRYERLNDPAMDPVVVKAVRAFVRQKKIVTHECIIDVGERIAAAKEQAHREEVERRIAEAVEEERVRCETEFKKRSQVEKEELKSTWIEKIDNTDQIAAEAAREAETKIRNEMESKIRMIEEVHQGVVEQAVRERLAAAREEWSSEAKEMVRLARIKCDREYGEKLEERVRTRLATEKDKWREEEEQRIVALSAELEAHYRGELAALTASHTAQLAALSLEVEQLTCQIAELKCRVKEEKAAHGKTKSALQDTRFHFSRFIREVPGFQSDFFTESFGRI